MVELDVAVHDNRQDMKTNTAPGPDGFIVLYFKQILDYN